jgi:heme/copper-type cytochrome/quinol oxidase subunit 2
MITLRQTAAWAMILTLVSVTAPCSAEDLPQIAVRLKDHRFEPSEIHVKSGQPTILVVTNADDTAEEFDSSALKVEKVIVAGHNATIRLRPLAPGRFPFMGEFHPETATGVVISE